ncbi:hypothetical protein BPAE_0092g00080 [Botrytis paeoniae]|uniref:Uncharacterized protein n=1 Tax=Botrytis paeoniae TaxID=278948 RepID=A0A4Z1FMY0_9HELO|nr:hypothetical protein BPAE_0092g00080 [Botrytis paeoniae]
MRNARSVSIAFIFQIEPPSTLEIRFTSPPQSINQSELSSQQLSMENRTDAPKYLDTERSPLSPPSNLEVMDLSANVLSPTSNHLNDENVEQTPLVPSSTSNTRSKPSNPTEKPIAPTANPSPPRLEKEFHQITKSKNRSSNTSPTPPPHNYNSTASNIPETNSDSESQTPSEHSSGSDAAFYCSVGSPSEDKEDGIGASLVLGAEGEVEGESCLMKKTLREAVSTSGTGVAADIEDDEEAKEEENEIHNKNSKRRKSKKRFTFLERLFGRKKSRDNDGGAGGIS